MSIEKGGPSEGEMGISSSNIEGELTKKETFQEVLEDSFETIENEKVDVKNVTEIQKYAAHELLSDCGIETAGKTPNEIRKEVEKPSFMERLRNGAKGKAGKAVRTLVLASMLTPAAGRISSAFASEDGEAPVSEIKTELKEEINLIEAMNIAKEYLEKLGDIEGLKQIEGDVVVKYLIQAAKIGSELKLNKDKFRGILDDIVEYTKFVKINDSSGSANSVDALKFGLDKIVVGDMEAQSAETVQSSEIKTITEQEFDNMDNSVKAMNIFLSHESTFEQRIAALQSLEIDEGEVISLNGVDVARKGDKFYYVVGGKGREITEDFANKLVEAYNSSRIK